jgi:hypothetical protein
MTPFQTIVANATSARATNWREANWECFWMVFHGQSRLTTFRNICALGVDRRTAAEMIQDCEREG